MCGDRATKPTYLRNSLPGRRRIVPEKEREICRIQHQRLYDHCRRGRLLYRIRF